MTRTLLRTARLLLPSVALAACGAGLDLGAPTPPATRAKAPEALWQGLADDPGRPFIVALAPAAGDRGAWGASKARLIDTAAPGELALERAWDELPLMQVRAASLDAAAALLGEGEVAAAYEVERYHLTDAESFPLINQPAAAAAGKTGAGTSIVIIDTGANYALADFGGCTAPGAPSTCKVAYAADVAASDGALDDNGHGTNVAGIALGVAPGARLIALDVFAGGGASSTDVITAVNWAIANKATYNIASMNLSLGGGASTAPCASDAMGTALASARAAGIAPVVASGNDAYLNALASPACAPAAISVGAVYDAGLGGLSYGTCADATTAADKVACFSNSASFLTLLAPGALITAAGSTMAGTSQAAPHVAGALAVLRAAFPTETVDQLVARLTSTGKAVTDPRNGVTKPRLDLAAAVGAASSGGGGGGTGGTTTDTAAPTGAVTINGGAAWTGAAAVTLAISASDPSGVASMCVTSATTCTTFEAFAASKAWTLPTGDGAKKVTVFLRDALGNTTTATSSPSATITLDTKAPTGGALTAATPASGQLLLGWSGFADAGTGVGSYRLAGNAGATPPPDCNTNLLVIGNLTSITITGLTDGSPYGFRVCAVDNAGRVSAGVTLTASSRPENVAPVGTVRLAGGAAYARAASVAVTLAATDASGVTSMCLSEGTTCTAFVAYATSATYAFAGADGSRTLRAWFRDRWGNTSAPVAATITLDTVAPAGGTLTGTAAAASLALAWTAATDATSGLASYKLVGAAGATAPAAGCGGGTALYAGTATSYAHAVTARAQWSYRLCAVDKAGNTSAGMTLTLSAL